MTDKHLQRLELIYSSWSILGPRGINIYLHKKRSIQNMMSFYCVQIYICILAWAFSSTKVIKSYSRSLPALERFYRETKFSLFKSTHSTKYLKTKLKTFPWLSRETQIKFKANQSRGSGVMIGQTNRQTEKKRLHLYISC